MSRETPHQAGYHQPRGWTDREGSEQTSVFDNERDAVVHVATRAAGGLRFHDLRHCYATWLVSAGVPVTMMNVNQR